VTTEVADASNSVTSTCFKKGHFYCTSTECVLPCSYQCWFASLVYVRILFMELIRLCPWRGISSRLVL
jgi:hypothetical protein